VLLVPPAPLAPDASDLPVKTVQESVVAPDLAPQINALEQQSSEHFVHEEKSAPATRWPPC
jgi:hypothetical protein